MIFRLPACQFCFSLPQLNKAPSSSSTWKDDGYSDDDADAWYLFSDLPGAQKTERQTGSPQRPADDIQPQNADFDDTGESW